MSNEDDDHVLFGTKFTNFLTQGKIKHKQDEIVTDDKGRRRFHGAFTGGFSAGYFNSVGSKEGFTPASFVSSKDNRHAVSNQSVDTYMDDEDMSAFGIAPKHIGKSREYKEERQASDNSLISIMTIDRDSKGIRLMKAMGWKPSFGVGPRKQVENKVSSVYTCQPPPGYKAHQGNQDGRSDHSDDDDMYKMGLYLAPTETTQYRLQPHTTTQGIGYTGLSGDKPSTSSNVSAVSGFSGEAFGVGALEEAEEYSVYDTDNRSNYNDRIIEEGESSIHDIHLSHKFNSTNTDYLSNFTSGKSDKYLRKVFPPPTLPPGYNPYHHPDIRIVERVNPSSSITERAVRLGISDFDRPAPTREAASAAPAVQETTKHDDSTIDTSSSNTQPLFRPFKNDPSKEERYNRFMAGKDIDYTSVNMTDWEQEREKDEFVKSSKFFKPLSWEMSSRFTSAGTNVEEEERNSLQKQAEEERREAVKMKMFGQLTRETHQWVPASLVCKRFDVMNPYPDIQSVGTIRRFNRLHTATKTSQVNEPSKPVSSAQPADNMPSTDIRDTGDTMGEKRRAPGIGSSEFGDDGDDRRLEEKMNDNMDLFKSVFAESSDEEDSDEQNDIHEDVTSSAERNTPSTSIKSEVKDAIDEDTSFKESSANKERESEQLLSQPVSVGNSASILSSSCSLPPTTVKQEVQNPAEELTPVIVPLPPSLTAGVSKASAPVGIVFNKARYGKTEKHSPSPIDLDEELLEKIRSIPDGGKKSKNKKEKKAKKKKKEKKKKRKKKHSITSASPLSDGNSRSRSRSMSPSKNRVDCDYSPHSRSLSQSRRRRTSHGTPSPERRPLSPRRKRHSSTENHEHGVKTAGKSRERRKSSSSESWYYLSPQSTSSRDRLSRKYSSRHSSQECDTPTTSGRRRRRSRKTSRRSRNDSSRNRSLSRSPSEARKFRDYSRFSDTTNRLPADEANSNYSAAKARIGHGISRGNNEKGHVWDQGHSGSGDRVESSRPSAVSRLGQRATAPSFDSASGGIGQSGHSRFQQQWSNPHDEHHSFRSNERPMKNVTPQTHQKRALPKDWQQPQQVNEAVKVGQNLCSGSPSVMANSGSIQTIHSDPSSSSSKRKKESEKKAAFVPKRARAIDFCDI